MEEANSCSLEHHEESCDSPQALFGEDFAYVAIAATVAWTYAIINAISYIA
jgi:hypothetical protein